MSNRFCYTEKNGGDISPAGGGSMKFSDKFIKANDALCDFENPVPAPYFRKSFVLHALPARAEITVCGLGFYELYINGKNVTKGPLAPYISNPDHIRYYDNYDITSFLVPGKNAVGVLAGNGMRNCYGGFVWRFDREKWRGPVTVALCFEAWDASGNSLAEWEADESFRTHPSPILYNDLRMGYYYDAERETENWCAPDFCDARWQNALPEKTPRGIARLCETAPIAVYEELSPVAIKHWDSLAFAYDNFLDKSYESEIQAPLPEAVRQDVYVYDFGKNTAGVTKLRINGFPGQKITVRHAEQCIGGRFSVNSTAFPYDTAGGAPSSAGKRTPLSVKAGKRNSFRGSSTMVSGMPL